MSTRGILFSIGGITVTVNGIFIALGLLFGFVLSCMQADRRRIRVEAAERVFVRMLIFGAIVSRIYFMIVNFGFYRSYPLAIFRIWEGGWSVFGALAGAIIGIYSATGKKGFRRALDMFAPGMFATIAIWRFAELFTWSGRGMIVGAGAYAFPFPIANAQGLNCVPVCLYECVAALALTAYSLLSENQRPGDMGLTAIMVLCLVQVPLESMRTDDYIRLSFVRMDQLLAMIIAETIIVMFILRYKRAAKDDFMPYVYLGMTVAMIALCVVAEFRIDRAGLVALHHAIESVYVGIMAMCGIIARNSPIEVRRPAAQRAANRTPQTAARQSMQQRSTSAYRREPQRTEAYSGGQNYSRAAQRSYSTAQYNGYTRSGSSAQNTGYTRYNGSTQNTGYTSRGSSSQNSVYTRQSSSTQRQSYSRTDTGSYSSRSDTQEYRRY